MNKHRVIACLTVFLICTAAIAQGLPRETRMEIVASTVQIVPLDETTGYLADFSGSGTIISPSGYILTNFHVIGDLDSRIHNHWAAIFWTDPDFTDQPPEPLFWAEYVTSDPTHDLALLQITEWFDETPVGDQQFPYSLVGDSNSMLPGDPVTFVGYPGISGRTITFTGGYMSGWVGEDFTSGGKQWIKTDGKISHGNSGGGAYDENGYLIGVPTAGRTIEYDQLDREEQAYIRPISLAWALMGPFVTDVARAPTTGKTGGSIAGSRGGSQTLGIGVQPTADEPPEECFDYCFGGVLGIDDAATATIAFPNGNPSPSYHTYIIEVPVGTEALTISAFGEGDIDLVVAYGNEVTDWSDEGNWWYRDFTDSWSGMVTIPNPAPGDWYVDVVLFYEGEAFDYDIFTFSDNIIGEEFFELCVSCYAGDIAPGATVQAVLTGYEDFLNYHTYTVFVPEGQSELRIDVEADGNLDIAIKFGEEIDDWGDGGNWDYSDASFENGGSFVIDNPSSGYWYLDVFTYYSDGTYTYTVSADITAAAGGSTTSALPASESSAQDSCNYNCTMAELGLNGMNEASLSSAASGSGSVYHTYTVEVPSNTGQLSIMVVGNREFDMVVGHGEHINTWADYGNWSYRAISNNDRTFATIPAPSVGTWYIDIVLFEDDATLEYDIYTFVEPIAGADMYELCESCYIAEIMAGTSIQAVMNSYDDFSNYHTYGLMVPEGQRELRVRVEADGDIDVAMKYGESVSAWGPSGDWDYIDDSFESGGEFVVANPTPGVWYIDIYSMYSDLTFTYTLDVQTF